MNILIREASINDAALIANLTRACWLNRVASNSSGHHEDITRVEQDLQHGGGFLLSLNDKIIGSVRWLPDDPETDVWLILRMGILPDFHGKSLSQHLLEAVIHRAQAADINELRLAVPADQPRLLDLYAAYEFELSPELEYNRANPEDASPTVIRRWLK
ncbi:MAG: GNAT family N-acetyltransferase [Glaciimonas sp.]|nr:GNAT family N-acetyltransferase [Glaciimonas sp.]